MISRWSKAMTPCRWVTMVLALGTAYCGNSDEPSESAAGPAPLVPPIVYTTKVKNLLTGLEITSQEAESVTKDPTALRALVDSWMATPEFRRKMLEFFKQAFQQTQLNFTQFEEQIGSALPNVSPTIKAYVVRSAEMSFPLTALNLIDEGRPFTEVLTTDRHMLNPPLQMLITYFDNNVVDDDGNKSTFLSTKFGARFKFVLHYDDGVQVPFEESIDPNSPHFLNFYEKCPQTNGVPKCGTTTVDASDRVNQSLITYLLAQKFTDVDWNDWRLIRLRPPNAGEDSAIYWTLPAFRSKAAEKQELALLVPRVGFMTTPAFFANWPTNSSNLARATINQTLIVGLGYSLADSNAIVPVSETGNPDAEHSQPGTTCFACHQTLDPMRNFFRQDFSVTYHRQTLALKPEQQVAKFIVDGTETEGRGVRDLAATMAKQARFASAWTQKLCQYANSSSCVEDDPEFIRVTDVFRASNYDFKSLVRELFSSPLVTLAAKTKTGDEVGGAVTIARRDHFCAALQNRLGLPDVCSLSSTEPNLLQNLSFGIPGSGYTRGAASPLLPRESNLFFSSSVEGLCGEVAARSVDPPACASGQRCFYSAEAPRAIGDMVHVIMSLPSLDARFADIEQILSDHYGEAIQAGYSPADALASTFVLACTSPLSSAIGL